MTNKDIYSGLNAHIDSGQYKSSSDQVEQNEMGERTKRDVSILGAKGQVAPMNLAHGLCPICVQ